jgi:hypothetical protein
MTYLDVFTRDRQYLSNVSDNASGQMHLNSRAAAAGRPSTPRTKTCPWGPRLFCGDPAFHPVPRVWPRCSRSTEAAHGSNGVYQHRCSCCSER